MTAADDCNSCDIRLNLAKLAKLIPFLSDGTVLEFFISLLEDLEDQDKHNFWTVISTTSNRYEQKKSVNSAIDPLGAHKLYIIQQWASAQTRTQKITFLLRGLSYTNSNTLSELAEYLSSFRHLETEEEFKPDPTHCPWSGRWPCFTETSGCVDFISKLPVTVAKLILSFVGHNHVWPGRLVSKRWYVLVKEFRREQTQFQSHVFRCRALRPAVRNVNPTYANKAALCFPLTAPCTTGHPYTSEEEERKVKVILEERNVYCGQYHQQHLLRYADQHRALHYCRGKYFAVGSKDRKVHIRSAETGKLHKTIVGHAGSIQSLLLIEKFKIVISGSYDLTIRAWSIETGAYLRLWRGHRGTITCLDHNETLLISGARDSMVKVWYLSKSILKRTLHHAKPILSVTLLGNRAGVGTEAKFFYLWDVDTGTKLQVYPVIGRVYSVTLTPHFILTGSQNVLYIWNMLSLDTTPMFTFPHPSSVLSVQYCYVRCITACQDGKLRIWSLVSGDCIKVIRGNARGDPITTVFVQHDRVLINTTSSVLSLNFQPTTWDYCCERYLGERESRDKSPARMQQSSKSHIRKRRCKSAVQLRNCLTDVTNQSAAFDPPFRPASQRTVKSVTLCMDVEEIPDRVPSAPPSSPEPTTEQPCNTQEEEEDEDCEREGTTVRESARQFSLFVDQFSRRPDREEEEVEVKPAIKPAAVKPVATLTLAGLRSVERVTTAEQLRKMHSRRPQSAPIHTASLSTFGHLPSFARRRPVTAHAIQGKVKVNPVEEWRSTWQKLLIEERSEEEQLATVAHVQRSFSRPKTATARIRY